MQALRRLASSASSGASISRCRPAYCNLHTARGGLMEEGSNFLKDGVKATVGHAGKKMKEAVGSKKPVTGEESQEPAGVMENRDSDENNQPQSRYKEVAEKGKKNYPGGKVTDLYQDSKKNAEATAESAKTKAKETRDPIS